MKDKVGVLFQLGGLCPRCWRIIIIYAFLSYYVYNNEACQNRFEKIRLRVRGLLVTEGWIPSISAHFVISPAFYRLRMLGPKSQPASHEHRALSLSNGIGARPYHYQYSRMRNISFYTRIRYRTTFSRDPGNCRSGLSISDSQNLRNGVRDYSQLGEPFWTGLQTPLLGDEMDAFMLVSVISFPPILLKNW